MPIAPVLATVAATVMALTLLAPPLSAEEKSMQRTITVSASGTADATPDQARITSGVSVEAATAREALSLNTEAMTKVITALKAKGIDARDIQTSSFSVDPVMDYPKEGGTPRLRGYRVSNQVQVLVRDLDTIGTILDEVVTAGANQVSGLAFEVSKEETLKDAARTDAVANAHRRAKLLAEAAGARVGKVMQISEETSQPGPMIFAARAAKAEAAPIERGTATLDARVTVTWELE